jgi:exonuclease III
MAIPSVITLNVHGLMDDGKRSRFFQFCRTHSFDVVFIQETHLSNFTLMEQWTKEWGAKAFWSFGTNHSKGVGILLSKRTLFKVLGFYHDFDGRLVSVSVKVGDEFFKFINVYCPNNELERKIFILSLKRHLHGRQVNVLGGDFNFVENLSRDKFGGNPNRGNIGHKELKIIKDDFDLVDVHDNGSHTNKLFTWASPDNLIKCRLAFYFRH